MYIWQLAGQWSPSEVDLRRLFRKFGYVKPRLVMVEGKAVIPSQPSTNAYRLPMEIETEFQVVSRASSRHHCPPKKKRISYSR